jgi:Cu(I)/Ag(I) efflux system membrane fusion protein
MKKTLYAVGFFVLLTAAFLTGRHVSRVSSKEAASASSHVLYYVDPMHPAYKSDKPGIAPDCGMQLVAVYADTTSSGVASARPAGTVRIDADQQQLIGLRTAEVQKSASNTSVRALGKVAVDDARIYRLNGSADGWLRQTFDGSVGSHVKKDEKLATFYSPEFVALEQGYLVATERMSATNKQQAAPGTQSTAARLRNLGMSDKQIAEIAETRLMPDNIEIVSPVDGFIIARDAAAGQRFNKGTELYRIADLSRVWIIAEVVESEALYFRPGMVASLSIPGQNRKLQARVSGALAQFDPLTRTMKVRMEAENPGLVLRPEMFVDIAMPVKLPSGLSIPVDALLDGGTDQRVFVDAGNGYFEPRAVRTGWRFNDRVEILNGLNEDERVVVAGTFLVDSESRLKNVASDSSRPPAILDSGGQP